MSSLPRVLAQVVLGMALVSPAAIADDMADARAAFRAAYELAERGIWSPTRREEALLRDYVLWPDLRGRFLEQTIGDASRDDVESFLKRHDGSSAARALRYRWARHLAGENRWEDYLDIHAAHYAALADTRLDCLALTATIRLKRDVDMERALQAWRHGASRPDECDAVFEWMADTGALTPAVRLERFELAIKQQNFSLARGIARRIDEAHVREAQTWLNLHSEPAEALTALRGQPDTPDVRAKLAYGLGRLGRIDTLYADELFRALGNDYAFTPGEAAGVAEELALIAAWRHEPYAARLIEAVEREHRSTELREWAVRVALRDGDWSAVLAAIAGLPDELKGASRWRYWHAMALSNVGATERAAGALRSLADERSYYAFLAADMLGLDYALRHERLTPDPAAQRELKTNPALIRARELYRVGLAGRGRSEWTRALGELPPSALPQAALLAEEWGWHSRAIATAASAGEFDDLELRYPVPYGEWFDEYAREARIAPTWALSIARSESLFMPDVRSAAGALGLMQLMPATGRETARRAGEPYAGTPTLIDPRANISLGTRYLASMWQRFDRHQALATAAYNAGPHRVERWLPADATLDAAIWIETIPFDETRRYVQRVLEAETVFYWRVNNRLRRVSDALKPVEAQPRQAAAAVTSGDRGG